jgi:hypothetical protein
MLLHPPFFICSPDNEFYIVREHHLGKLMNLEQRALE